nr:hypothetical protein [Candidatus Njordarchaeum guaymaensis]
MTEDVEMGEHGSISNVYIIVDGASVFHVKYWGESVEPNLVTGFLSAIASFAREVSKEAVLKTVSIPPLKIAALQVMEEPQVIVCIIADENFPILAAEEILQAIAKVFLDRHSQDIMDLKGMDLTSELSEDVLGAIVSSLRLLLKRLSRTEMRGDSAPNEDVLEKKTAEEKAIDFLKRL